MKNNLTQAPGAETATEADRELLTRLTAELEKLRPILWQEGGDAKVRGVADGVARIAFGEGSGSGGCGGTFSFLQGGFRLTLLEKVNGLKDIVFE